MHADRREWTMGEADAYDEGFCAGAAATRDEMRAEAAAAPATFLRQMAARLRDKAASESDFAAVAALETAADALERSEPTGLEYRGG